MEVTVRQAILYQQAEPLTSGQGTSEAGEEIADDIEDTGEQDAKSGCDDDEVGVETGQELSEQGLDDCGRGSLASVSNDMIRIMLTRNALQEHNQWQESVVDGLNEGDHYKADRQRRRKL